MITAEVIQYSKCARTGKEIVTFELVYPRIVHSEFMTHRMFSRNAASSRAIPIYKVIDMVRKDPAMPSHWGKNQAGMQAREELTGFELDAVRELWIDAALNAADIAEHMDSLGAHKQVANRIMEPFQWMKVVVTYTEGENWYWLRDHVDADPTIHELAKRMWEAVSNKTPFEIFPGEWHVPYVNRIRGADGIKYLTEIYIEDDVYETQFLTLEEALAVSSSCCAQVSYRLLDLSLTKALAIYARLVESEPVHASPFEHQATPIPPESKWEYAYDPMGGHFDSGYYVWPEGVTHVDRAGKYWSANFQGYIQHRQLIPNNVKKG